jgi:Excalibur calcium-binding domain
LSSILALAVVASLVFLAAASAASGSVVATASDYDCADFANQAEAEEYLLPGDPYRLDADHDGIACEDLPCPCSSSPGGDENPPPPPPPPEPPKLNGAAARSAARSKARRFDRRNRQVSGVKLQRCARRSRHRIDCSLTAKGKTGNRVTTCSLTVIVRGEGNSASASLRARCRSEAFLSYARARSAMKAEADAIAEKPAGLFGIERRTRLSFVGEAEWTRSTPAPEQCLVELIASLLSSGSILVHSQGVECAAV